jgi:small subunit ribosomal protein S19e|uniref:Small ribosomal subunit protein eS19 n=2 Tax=environmental samples TaxID=651140 RepID=A0A075GX15_9ARCH|nr:ribosomal protein S19e (RP-S19e, RPS19) [uncultured marine thaumarchaeote KM3_203_A01]AIF07860.1 ribosomal protein S19e (RP-S19e, RPS19) [uncultured marine thaumarchaeote KM3_25_B05]|tara:strand:- start:74 stop:529 length:456 start_codon:yes stop_codon:yes gene_type:complete
MAKVYDVPANALISKLAEVLKTEDIPAPSWSLFVKTGAHADKPPQKSDWWHTRCASILRKIYLHGPISVNELRTMYGDGKRNMYYGARHHKDASGAIIRNAMHGLEKLGYVEKVEKKGRVLSRQGMQKLDKMSTEILNEMIQKTPKLKIYS